MSVRYLLLPLFLFTLSVTSFGCGSSAPETDEKQTQQMEKLENDPEYQQQMMGGEKKK